MLVSGKSISLTCPCFFALFTQLSQAKNSPSILQNGVSFQLPALAPHTKVSCASKSNFLNILSQRKLSSYCLFLPASLSRRPFGPTSSPLFREMHLHCRSHTTMSLLGEAPAVSRSPTGYLRTCQVHHPVCPWCHGN